MAVDHGLIDWVSEAMAPMGTVTMRRMMGGATLYLDGAIFAIALEERLWFKADGTSDPAWDTAGCDRFTFVMKGEKVVSMNYRAAPDDVYDDPDAMRHWAAMAVAAGLRARLKKPARKPARKGRPPQDS